MDGVNEPSERKSDDPVTEPSALEKDQAEVFFDRAKALQNESPQEAIALYKLASDLGDARALANLGQVYERLGNPAEAEECYRAAIKRGAIRAKLALSVLVEDRNPEEASRLLDEAVEAGDARAIYRLGKSRYDANAPEGLELIRRAAELGYPHALYQLALLCLKTDPAEAERLLRLACDLGSSAAKGLLGYMLMNRDPSEAKSLLQDDART